MDTYREVRAHDADGAPIPTTSRTTLCARAILAFGIAGAALVATGRAATAVFVELNGGLPGRRRLRDSGGRRDCGTGDISCPRAGFRCVRVTICIQACSAAPP